MLLGDIPYSVLWGSLGCFRGTRVFRVSVFGLGVSVFPGSLLFLKFLVEFKLWGEVLGPF